MNPETRNRLITFGVLFFAGLILSITFLGPGTAPDEPAKSTTEAVAPEVAAEPATSQTPPTEAAPTAPANG